MKLQKEKLQAALERRILHGLSCEWHSAVQDLELDYPQTPLFSLKTMKQRLGYWSSLKKEICLSREFVLNHPWDSIRDVLLHEAAHQLTEHLGINEKPHGPFFQKACVMLNADPSSTGCYKNLHERMNIHDLKDGDKLFLKVKKLLALAESTNQHEAESAMVKAHQLIEKYNIDLLSQYKARNFFSIFIDKPALRHFKETYSLANLLTSFYFVKGIWISAYVIEKEKMGRVLEISGTARNIKIASYVHAFITQYIDQEWKTYNHKKKLNRYRKSDFSVGIIAGFYSKLESSLYTGDKSSRDLVRIDDPQLKAYYQTRYPRTEKICHRSSLKDHNIHQDGVELGKKLIIFQGVEEHQDSGNKLLPG